MAAAANEHLRNHIATAKSTLQTLKLNLVRLELLIIPNTNSKLYTLCIFAKSFGGFSNTSDFISDYT